MKNKARSESEQPDIAQLTTHSTMSPTVPPEKRQTVWYGIYTFVRLFNPANLLTLFNLFWWRIRSVGGLIWSRPYDGDFNSIPHRFANTLPGKTKGVCKVMTNRCHEKCRGHNMPAVNYWLRAHALHCSIHGMSLCRSRGVPRPALCVRVSSCPPGVSSRSLSTEQTTCTNTSAFHLHSQSTETGVVWFCWRVV